MTVSHKLDHYCEVKEKATDINIQKSLKCDMQYYRDRWVLVPPVKPSDVIVQVTTVPLCVTQSQ